MKRYPKKRMGSVWVAGALGLFLGLACQRSAAPKPKADLILTNGRFFTVDAKHPLAEAVAILGDRILAVGSEQELEIYRQEGTKVLNLGGRFACPGFNDAHVQDLAGHLNTADIDLYGVTSMEEIQNRIRAVLRRQNQPMDIWLVGRGWDQSILTDVEGWPNKDHLQTRIWTDRPIVCYRVCGHAALVNKKALKIANIDKNTPSPPGGEIVKDPRTGEPTGLLKESAMRLLDAFLPRPEIGRLGAGVRQTLRLARQNGVTSLQGRGTPLLFSIFKAFKDADSLTCRINYWGDLTDGAQAVRGLRRSSDDALLRVGLLSESLDGSMGTHGAALLWPYLDEPDQRGIPKLSQEALTQAVMAADQAGEQVAIHTVGDAAVHMALESFSLTSRLHKGGEHRPRLEHVQLVVPEDMARMGKLGVTASVQPAHLLDDIRWVENRLGESRCEQAYAWRSLRDQGVPLAFGTYWPVASLNPMRGLYAAVTRRDTLGQPIEGWNPQQRLTREEAIEAYTLGSAYAEDREKDKGSLSPGKLADIVVLDHDILHCPPSQMLQTRVVMTFLGGKIVYQQKSDEGR